MGRTNDVERLAALIRLHPAAGSGRQIAIASARDSQRAADVARELARVPPGAVITPVVLWELRFGPLRLRHLAFDTIFVLPPADAVEESDIDELLTAREASTPARVVLLTDLMRSR